MLVFKDLKSKSKKELIQLIEDLAEVNHIIDGDVIITGLGNIRIVNESGNLKLQEHIDSFAEELKRRY